VDIVHRLLLKSYTGYNVKREIKIYFKKRKIITQYKIHLIALLGFGDLHYTYLLKEVSM